MREPCATIWQKNARAWASKAVREGARRRTHAAWCLGHRERAGPAPLALSQLPPRRLVERVPLSRTREIATPTEAVSSGICSLLIYTPPLRPTYTSKFFITTQHGTTEALSLQIIAQRFSSTFGVPHTKLQQRCRACSWAGVHVEVRTACDVREEVAAGLTAAQSYGARSVLARLATGNFAPFSKHRACVRAHIAIGGACVVRAGPRGLLQTTRYLSAYFFVWSPDHKCARSLCASSTISDE